MSHSFSHSLKWAIDTLFPPQCPSCSAIVDDHGHLCSHCWTQIRFIGTPACPRCGVPLPYDPGSCPVPCMESLPSFDAARSVMLYDDFSRTLVLKFKHSDRLDPAGVYAGWMGRAGQSLLDGADIIVPVPLHWTRPFSRRYNQSALLAQRIAAQSGVDYGSDIMSRTRRTPSQGTLTRNRRAQNVRGAFQVSVGKGDDVKGKHIVLIDDVMTTGATAGACARALKRAGALSVRVLTLARVALPGDQSI